MLTLFRPQKWARCRLVPGHTALSGLHPSLTRETKAAHWFLHNAVSFRRLLVLTASPFHHKKLLDMSFTLISPWTLIAFLLSAPADGAMIAHSGRFHFFLIEQDL